MQLSRKNKTGIIVGFLNDLQKEGIKNFVKTFGEMAKLKDFKGRKIFTRLPACQSER